MTLTSHLLLVNLLAAAAWPLPMVALALRCPTAMTRNNATGAAALWLLARPEREFCNRSVALPVVLALAAIASARVAAASVARAR